MKTHESTIGPGLLLASEYAKLVPGDVKTKATGVQKIDNETRPLQESDSRFVQETRYAPVHPKLQLLNLVEGFASLYTAKPTSVKDITVNPMEFLSAVKKMTVNEEGMLERGIVPINVSDLDGTLWKEPIADILVYKTLCSDNENEKPEALRGKRLKPVIRGKLTALLSEMGLDATGLDQPDKGVNADVLRAKAWFDKHKGSFSREQLEDWSRRVYPLTSWSLAGFSVKEVQQMTRDIVRAKNLKGVAFRGARAKVITLKRAGIPTALFSASNTILAQAAVDEIFGGKKTHLNVVGTDVRVDDNGILTTEVINGGPCFRENKLKKVKAFMKEYVKKHYKNYAHREMRPLLASGDSPSKTDEQMMEYAEYACADEPGTKRDVKLALERAQRTGKKAGRYFILDYLKTVGGKAANSFLVDQPLGGAAGAL